MLIDLESVNVLNCAYACWTCYNSLGLLAGLLPRWASPSHAPTPLASTSRLFRHLGSARGFRAAWHCPVLHHYMRNFLGWLETRLAQNTLSFP